MDRPKTDPLDTILAKIIEQRLAGKEPQADAEAVLAAHPDKADELRARLADLEKLDALWKHVLPTIEGPGDQGLRAHPGTRLGDFEIQRELGRGGMGTVYLARQESLKRVVALKVIPQAAALSKPTRQRFLREAEAMGALSHPNIVPIYAAGEVGGTFYIAMEYIEGVSLADVLDALRSRRAQDKPSDTWRLALSGEAPGPPEASDAAGPAVPSLDKEYVETCCRTVAAVAEALHFAHERGIIHRDVKPGNIFIDRQGRARLGDFGLAAVNTQPHVTLSGEFFGTPYYVSPEQARGRHDLVDGRSDVYSLGATLYECLTLSPPFEAASAPEVLTLVLQAEPAPPRRVNPSISRDLDTIVLKAISKEADDRYETAAALAEDIQRLLSYQPIVARPVRLPTRLLKRIRRKPVHAALVVAACLAVVAAAIGYWAVGAYRRAGKQVRKVEKRAQQTEQQMQARELYELGKAELAGGLLRGQRIAYSPAKAAEHFEAAAKLAHVDAMRELAELYLRGPGVKKDARAAAYWAKRAIDGGSSSCEALYAESLLQIPSRRKEGYTLLAEALGNEDKKVRGDAVSVLAKQQGAQAVELLIAALKDASYSVRGKAASALADLRDKRAVVPLIALMNDPNQWVHEQAIYALAYLGGKRALAPLLAAMKDEDPEIRELAAGQIWRLGDPQAVEPLIETLKDPRWHVRWKAALSLGRLGDKRAFDPLVAALRDKNSMVRNRAAAALGGLGDPRAVEPLTAALKANPTMHRAVFGALAHLGEPQALALVIAAQKDQDSDVRRSVVLALAHVRDPGGRAVQALIAALHDPDELIRFEAADGLVQQPDVQGLEALLALLEHKDQSVRDRGVRIWERLRGRGAVESFSKALASKDPRFRRAAAEALGRLGNRRAVEALIPALRDESQAVQFYAAWALVRLRDERGIQALLAALKGPQASVRRWATLALGELREKRAVQPLIALLKDPDARVRQAAAEALANLRDKSP